MVQFLFVLAVVGGGAAYELAQLKRQGCKKEIAVYLMMILTALAVLGAQIFWRGMPSIYELIAG